MCPAFQIECAHEVGDGICSLSGYHSYCCTAFVSYTSARPKCSVTVRVQRMEKNEPSLTSSPGHVIALKWYNRMVKRNYKCFDLNDQFAVLTVLAFTYNKPMWKKHVQGNALPTFLLCVIIQRSQRLGRT